MDLNALATGITPLARTLARRAGTSPEDVTQEAFLAVLRKPALLEGGPVHPTFIRVMQIVAKRLRRTNLAGPPVDPDATQSALDAVPDPSSTATEDQEHHAAVLAALREEVDRLDARERELVFLCLDGATREEMARTTGTRPSRARAGLERSKEAVRKSDRVRRLVEDDC